MDLRPKIVAVTGGAGQIAYSLLFRIASGEMFGPHQPIHLRIIEIPEAIGAAEGVAMELIDCAYPLLQDVQVGSDPFTLFEGADVALLIGASPRGPGMERKDLLEKNAKIFINQGKALNQHASREVIVLVVGNPCNTNALIARSHAPNLNGSRFFAMTMLDENRAHAQLALQAKTPVSHIEKLIIWGNHSSTQVPDFTHVHINGKPIAEMISDRNWLETTFFDLVQKRGAAIISTRGKSSAASAANAIIDTVHSLIHPTEEGKFFSVATLSDGNPYQIQNNLFFSFPCISKGDGHVEIVPNIEWDPFIQEKIALTEKELLEEREAIQELM